MENGFEEIIKEVRKDIDKLPKWEQDYLFQ